uniref:CSON010625 protein n=1 Tax=Culicoides sonorensis TaxID=179676 RepID=A0A336KLY2_CULSO
MDNQLGIKQEIELHCGSPSQSPNSNTTQLSSFNNSSNKPSSNFSFNIAKQLNKEGSNPSSPDHQYCSSTSALGDLTNDSLCQDNVKDDLPRRLCLVCGDIASGFHYGVASCEACKAFFKRTIQGNIEYTCPANNECEINKRRRKACQSCRYRKCLLMGMLKEGVRLDRVRGGRQKYRRNPPQSSSSSPYQLQINPSNYSNPVQSLHDIKVLEIIAKLEPDQLSAQCGFDLNNRCNRGSAVRNAIDTHEIFSVLSDLYDKELVGIIGWAKQIPGFLDLPLNDQMRLLQVSWTEILTLMLVYRSVPFTGRLYFASDFWLDERIAEECDAIELYNQYSLVAQRFDRINISKEEYYLLKALALSNCDIRLDNSQALKRLRDTILTALDDVVLLTRHANAVSHQQQLLLLLPSLRQCDFVVRKFWTTMHREGSITMNKLFVEMLEAVSR